MRRILFSVVAATTLISSSAFAQQAIQQQQFDIPPEVQQMIDIGQQIQQRMQDKGIDPQTMQQQMQQQMQDGSFDPNKMMQGLVDQGLIDPNQLNTLQSGMQRLQQGAQQRQMDNLKNQLAAGDEEWAVLQGKIQKVMSIMTQVQVANPGGGGANLRMAMAAPTANDPVSKSLADLKAAVKDPETLPAKVSILLSAYRQELGKAKEGLDAARKDLQSVVTVRQEAILLETGILE